MNGKNYFVRFRAVVRFRVVRLAAFRPAMELVILQPELSTFRMVLSASADVLPAFTAAFL